MGKTLYHAAATMLLMALCGGCSMCQQCELDSYSGYGGRWQRTDRDHGRVGSVFAPAGALFPYDNPPGVPADSVGSELLAPEPIDDLDAAPEVRPDQPLGPAPSELDQQAEEERKARERRLRELQLEDIRYQY